MIGVESSVLVRYVLVGILVRARQLPGLLIPDALIVAASLGSDALPLLTFDRDQHRYGIATRGAVRELRS